MAPDLAFFPEPRTSDQRLLYYGGLGALLGDVALVAGLAIVSLAGAVARFEYQVNDPVPVVPFAAYAFLGCAAVGAVVAILYDRHRTVSPAAVAVLAFVVATLTTLGSTPYAAGQATPLERTLLAWPLVLLGAAAAWGLERFLRRSDRRADERLPKRR